MARSTIVGTFLRLTTMGVLSFLAFCLSNAQTSDRALTFEAASIKPTAMLTGRALMAAPSGGPGTQDPGRVHYPFISLKAMLSSAYDVKPYQIDGPAWLNGEMFDVNATMPPETTKEQFRVMLQNLLKERFKLTVHQAMKQVPMYSLIVEKSGPKMKESNAVSPAPGEDHSAFVAPLSAPQIGQDGFPVLPLSAKAHAGLFLMMMPGRARLIGQQQTMLDLANRLATLLNGPVDDATGLTAKYDFTLTFSPEGMTAPMGTPTGVGTAVPISPAPVLGSTAGTPSPESDTLPDIFGAAKEQLGLVVERKNGPLYEIVVDHVERMPTGN